MDAITYTSARENLAQTMDRVCDDHDPVVITRRKGRNVVLVSQEDWSALEETAYLLRSPANVARLRRSIADADRGAHEPNTLLDE